MSNSSRRTSNLTTTNGDYINTPISNANSNKSSHKQQKS